MSAGLFAGVLYIEDSLWMFKLPASIIVSIAGSFPAFVLLAIALPVIRRFFHNYQNRVAAIILLFVFIAMVYGCMAGLIAAFSFVNQNRLLEFISIASIAFAYILAAALIALFINLNISAFIFYQTKTQLQWKLLQVILPPVKMKIILQTKSG